MQEGIIQTFMDAGFCVTNPTCGACLGMSTGVLAAGEVCASTTNRNFNGRMGKGGMVHLMSPLSAAAAAVAGCITDPRQYL
jgi:3-isopropylmalate/(R)-2-methylmalate dehydratase large subunit